MHMQRFKLVDSSDYHGKCDFLPVWLQPRKYKHSFLVNYMTVGQD